MSDLQSWRQALELLPGEEAEELRQLMQRRAERLAQRAPAAAPRGKGAAAPKAEASSPPAPDKPENRIYYVSSDPNDKLADFRSKARPGDAQPCWIDGV